MLLHPSMSYEKNKGIAYIEMHNWFSFNESLINETRREEKK